MAIEERINKDGSRSFRSRVKDRVGKFYQSSWKRNRDEAMGEEAEQLAKKRVGEQSLDLSNEGSRYTVDEFWGVYQVENRVAVSEGWKISQDQMWRDYCSPIIGKRRLSEVGIPEIGRILTRMAELGRGPQLRKHVYGLLNQVFDSAVNYYGMIKTNPVSAKYHGVKVPETESAFLRPEQSWRLLEVAVDEPAVWIELLAGLRTEATVALTWPNVLWDLNQFYICRAWKHKIRRIEEFTKGRKPEYVPMTPVLKDYLWERYLRVPEVDRTGLVCLSPRGKQLTPETLLPRLKGLCRKARLPEVSPHKLRHSCTELFVSEGASQEDLRRLLNHKRGTTTIRYMHRTDDRLQAIAARIQKPDLKLVVNGTVTHGVTHVGNKRRMLLSDRSGK